MNRRNRDRPIAVSALLVGLLAALGLSLLIAGCETVPASAKPDVHLVFDIHEDGSNTCALEVAVHPLVDSFVRHGLEVAGQWLVDVPTPIVLESEERVREGRKYAAVVAQFDSLGDLNAFVNTPQLLSGLLSLLTPDAAVPPLFAEFEVWSDLEASPHVYGVNARIDEETAAALSFVNFTVHFTLPHGADQHNATQAKGRVLSWQVDQGQALTLEATAAESKAEAVVTSVRRALASGATPWIIGGVGLVLIAALAIGIAYWRAGRPPADDYDF